MIKRKMAWDEEGDMGIGTMIIFIAMVLVAAVAATVLITTAGILQQQATDTGIAAIAEVSNSIVVRNIAGDRYDYTDPTNYSTELEILEIKISLAAGSPPISFKNLLIEISDGETDVSLLFDRLAETTYYAGGAINASATEFSAESLRDPEGTFDGTGSGSIANILSPGGIVKIFINCTATGLSIGPQTDVDMKFMPKHGVPTYEAFSTPETYTTRYIQLW